MKEALEGSVTRAWVSSRWRKVLRWPQRSAFFMRAGSCLRNQAQVVEEIPPGMGRLPARRGWRCLPIFFSSARAISVERRVLLGKNGGGGPALVVHARHEGGLGGWASGAAGF